LLKSKWKGRSMPWAAWSSTASSRSNDRARLDAVTTRRRTVERT
jgi:hypothetical protein